MPLPDQLPLSPAEVALARERGRLKSLERLMVDPVQRQRIEQRWGLEFCRRKWPELYSTAAITPAARFNAFIQRTFGIGSGVKVNGRTV